MNRKQGIFKLRTTKVASPIYIVVSLLKVVIGLVGLSLTFWYLVQNISNRDKDGKRKAFKAFLASVGIVVLITALEFLFAVL